MKITLGSIVLTKDRLETIEQVLCVTKARGWTFIHDEELMRQLLVNGYVTKCYAKDGWVRSTDKLESRYLKLKKKILTKDTDAC